MKTLVSFQLWSAPAAPPLLATLVLALTGLTLDSRAGRSPGHGFDCLAPRRAAGESLQLTQKAGPWLIMCASFDGSRRPTTGQTLGHRACARNTASKAYVFHKTFRHRKTDLKARLGVSKNHNAPGEQNV
jgi:hypothetical protein